MKKKKKKKKKKKSLALYYRNFLSFLSFNIYLYGILGQIFSSRPSLEFQTAFFYVKSLKNIFSHNFYSLEDMTTKF